MLSKTSGNPDSRKCFKRKNISMDLSNNTGNFHKATKRKGKNYFANKGELFAEKEPNHLQFFARSPTFKILTKNH